MVEVGIAGFAHLDHQRVQVRAVCVGDQLLNLLRRLDPVVKRIHPQCAVLRRSEHYRARRGAWAAWRRSRGRLARARPGEDHERYRAGSWPAHLRASSTWFRPVVEIIPGCSRFSVAMASRLIASRLSEGTVSRRA